jgi:shikimate dehydrogenase
VKNFGLIGRSLKHSFSREYFEKKFETLGLNDHHYLLFEIQSVEQFPEIIETIDHLKGVNVTIPYKESILPYLDELHGEASEINAVNCIRIKNGRLSGYNTDVYGFAQSIKPFLDTGHERALILGTGGASKAVAHALRKIGVHVFFVTSSPAKKNADTFLFSEVNERMMGACRLIVNATPLGMYPDVGSAPPIPYQYFTQSHLAYDLIYFPSETNFLQKAKQYGAVTVNGLSMLQLQAEKSWEIWNAGE